MNTGCAWTDDGVRAQVADLGRALFEHMCLIGKDGVCDCGAIWIRRDLRSVSSPELPPTDEEGSN